jgi:hypothetical protein
MRKPHQIIFSRIWAFSPTLLRLKTPQNRRNLVINQRINPYKDLNFYFNFLELLLYTCKYILKIIRLGIKEGAELFLF